MEVPLLAVLVYPGKGLERPDIIDIHTLGGVAFWTVGVLGMSLKDILESPEIVKDFMTTNGEKLWGPDKEGSYDVLNVRPLPKEIIAYCVGDVQYLPVLYRVFTCGTVRWFGLITVESQNRVSASRQPAYNPRDTDRALSTWNVEQNKLLNSWAEATRRKGYFGGYLEDPMHGPWNDEAYWGDGDDNDYDRDAITIVITIQSHPWVTRTGQERIGRDLHLELQGKAN
ncbi:unnamed protein product [Fusarium graminearum]|uniref:Uncharacterized protein n=1 Tax=Gibberella zeae TaxID=5518 RepID=A0A4E9ELJ8_GIBZA|nr:unnamed protein product [Fusarium langsethiae]CAF3454302.1 unnamed protein product [Fusarium graminearum]